MLKAHQWEQLGGKGCLAAPPAPSRPCCFNVNNQLEAISRIFNDCHWAHSTLLNSERFDFMWILLIETFRPIFCQLFSALCQEKNCAIFACSFNQPLIIKRGRYRFAFDKKLMSENSKNHLWKLSPTVMKQKHVDWLIYESHILFIDGSYEMNCEGCCDAMSEICCWCGWQ